MNIHLLIFIRTARSSSQFNTIRNNNNNNNNTNNIIQRVVDIILKNKFLSINLVVYKGREMKLVIKVT